MTKPFCHVEIGYRVETVTDDSDRFLAACEWVAGKFGLREFVVSIGIVDDPTIRELNREHLSHDWTTDVISFVFERNGNRVDGEIVASADTAKRVCQVAGWPAEDELLLYVVHGLLHLAGLDDIELDGQTAMRDAEQQCLSALGVAGAKAHVERWDEIE